MGTKTCSVIVIPQGRYEIEVHDSGKGGKKDNSPKMAEPKGIKSGDIGNGGKKGSKKGIIDDTQGLHNRNDFRKEYRLSTQRYLLSEENHDWEPTRNTFLVVPPSLIPSSALLDFFDITQSHESGKKSGKSKSFKADKTDMIVSIRDNLTNSKKGGKKDLLLRFCSAINLLCVQLNLIRFLVRNLARS
jgi:hypothetical protein